MIKIDWYAVFTNPFLLKACLLSLLIIVGAFFLRDTIRSVRIVFKHLVDGNSLLRYFYAIFINKKEDSMNSQSTNPSELSSGSGKYICNALILDTNKMTLSYKGKSIEFDNTQEYKFLKILFVKMPSVVTYAEFAEELKLNTSDIQEIKAQIQRLKSNLKSKLNNELSLPFDVFDATFVSKAGTGYRLTCTK